MATFTAGSKLTADALNAEFARQRRVYQTADATVNNTTTFTSSNDMVLSVEASVFYTVTMYIIVDSGTTPDFKYNLLLPSGAVVVKHSRWGGNAADTTEAAAPHRLSTDVNGYDLSGIGAGTLVTNLPQAIIATSTTAGSCTFQFSQQTANASNTILRAGSWMELYKLTA